MRKKQLNVCIFSILNSYDVTLSCHARSFIFTFFTNSWSIHNCAMILYPFTQLVPISLLLRALVNKTAQNIHDSLIKLETIYFIDKLAGMLNDACIVIYGLSKTSRVFCMLVHLFLSQTLLFGTFVPCVCWDFHIIFFDENDYILYTLLVRV